MASIFSKIVAGEIPSYKVAEDEQYYAFLDINPVVKGHTLVIPKHEVNYIFDLPQEEYEGLWAFARKVAKAMKNVMPCERIGVAVMGLEVPHAHIHLLPINKESDMNFFTKKLTLPADEMAAVAKKINDEFVKLNK
jgi:histidine triad (HIT) family protein